jgi:aspartyl-tRNA(Asn)/glutamyl-tRNA(Gln) amidotransferase subunit C
MPDGVHEVDIAHLARLVRLDLTPEECRLFSSQLVSIVAYARQVQGVDTSGVSPSARATESGTHERPDVEGPCLSPHDALADAPDPSRRGPWFRVPKVIGS